MIRDHAIERLRDAINRQARMPPRALIDSMVKRGVIDEQGRVLIRMPIGEKPTESPTRKPAASGRPRKRKA